MITVCFDPENHTSYMPIENPSSNSSAGSSSTSNLLGLFNNMPLEPRLSCWSTKTTDLAAVWNPEIRRVSWSQAAFEAKQTAVGFTKDRISLLKRVLLGHEFRQSLNKHEQPNKQTCIYNWHSFLEPPPINFPKTGKREKKKHRLMSSGWPALGKSGRLTSNEPLPRLAWWLRQQTFERIRLCLFRPAWRTMKGPPL